MENSEVRVGGRSKIFLMVSTLFLVAAIFINLAFGMLRPNQPGQTGQEIFYEDAVPVSGTLREKAKPNMLVPVGITSGVRFYTQGIVVLGAGDVVLASGATASPSRGRLLPGDIVTKIGGNLVEDIGEMTDAIHVSGDRVVLSILRDETAMDVEIAPVKCADSGTSKIGCWVRDSTQGIGTITYYCPKTWHFGALGHGIVDVDTQKLLTVRQGQLTEAEIVDVRKGKKGCPGELIGETNNQVVLGQITKNCRLGIYGSINRNYHALPKATFPVACHHNTTRGPAQILSNIEGGQVRAYDIFIENINAVQQSDKSMVIRITDPDLISRTGGIVQGMSGSPIIQGNHLVGAVTHVFVQSPLRGYGVFVEKMVAEN